MTLLSMGVDERRSRLARRHLLSSEAKAENPVDVANALVALHATDPATVYLSACARLASREIGAVEKALYDDKSLIRMLGMRRTMFVVSDDLAPIVHAACSRALAVQQRKRFVQLFESAELADDVPAWLEDIEESTLRALEKRGEATAAELSTDEPRLRTTIISSPGKPYEAKQTITTWVLLLMALEGRIIRGRPRGTWISSQYRWSPINRWLPEGVDEWDTGLARAELVRRWLRSFGPGTIADLRWWTGLGAAEIKRALSTLDTVEVDLDGVSGLVLADDVAPTPSSAPWVALLPALDPTVMGWTQRDWYLGSHGPALFDRSGNPGPTIWCDGRIVGGWAQRRDGTIAFRLLEDIGREAMSAVEAEAARWETWYGPIRAIPRFRTPLERELSS